MAYSVLVSLAKATDLILDPLKYSISVAENEQITSIREHAISLMSLLESFPKKSNRLEGKMRDVAAEAEDIIEDFMWEQIHSSEGVGPTRVEFEPKLIGVRKEIGSIVSDMMMDDRLGDSPAAAISSSSRLPPTGKNDIVVGLDEELIAIKSRLCGESSKLEYIPILGMGGIGKSTLARCAYDDKLTVEHFYIRAWITISQDYSPRDVLSCLLDTMKMFDDQLLEHGDEFTMREKVYKCLKSRMYLVVLDDVWSTAALDDVRNIFPDDDNGSRIILTTRLSDVATYAVSDSLVHELRFMDDDQCWSLLKQKVFANGQGCPSELEDVGKQIARSCRGLPLAVVLIAGVLSKMDETRASWEEILKNLLSIVGERSEEILSLSYTYLPHNLRSCFLYLGGFPEDHEVRVSELIKLWVAEGFLQRTNESKSLEEEAEEYLEELVDRSLVLVRSRKSSGEIKRCSLHDLVRDLCIRKAREGKFFTAKDDCADARRLSITNSSKLYNVGVSTVRTIFYFRWFQKSVSVDLLGAPKLLRVLHVANESGEPYPFSILELFHLRYLALGDLIHNTLPFYMLVNLHTLVINRKTQPMIDRILPFQIWEMPLLRHLIVYYLHTLPDYPPKTRPLKNLKTLMVVSANKSFLKKMFPNVSKLGLIFDKIEHHGPYPLPNLTDLNQLEKLKVIIKDSCRVGRNSGFPRTLKKLTISGGRFLWEDMSVIGSLPNLQVLKLTGYACHGDTWETAEGEFPRLEFLLIVKSNLRDWITESSHFPRLRCLILRLCLFLTEVPDSIAEITSLKVIEVDYRNKRLVKSVKDILEDQQSQGNDDLQVRIIPSLHESFSVEKRSGKKCHMIGARDLEIVGSDNRDDWKWKPCADSRFLVMAKQAITYTLDISVKIDTHILSSNTTYAAYLVFKLAERCYGLKSVNAVVRFGSNEAAQETTVVVHLERYDGAQEQKETHPVRRDDGWMEVEMGSFYNNNDDDDGDGDGGGGGGGEVEVRLTGINDQPKKGLIIEGIEFRPKAQFDDLEDKHPLVVSQSKSHINSPMCHAVGAKELTIEWGDNPLHWQWKACADSRFAEVVELNCICKLEISVKIKRENLFSSTTYAAYLVYKLAEQCYGLKSVRGVVRTDVSDHVRCITVELQQLADEKGRPRKRNKRRPVRRDDGWMEIEMGSFYNNDYGERVAFAKLMGDDVETRKKGLIIECIEFRPKP